MAVLGGLAVSYERGSPIRHGWGSDPSLFFLTQCIPLPPALSLLKAPALISRNVLIKWF
jgi:hypothetical protein